MPYDVQVLVHAILYFIIFLLGFAVAVPLGVTVTEFSNHCILYTEWNWINATYATYNLRGPEICNFPVYFAVFACILYGLVMGIYNMYAVCKSKDPNIGFQMWVMPFLLINALIVIVMFVACCVVSVGLKSLCDSLLDGREKDSKLTSCADAVHINWNYGKTNYTYQHFYSYPKASEVAAWLTFLVWLAQELLYAFRVIRNRCHRSQGSELHPNIVGTKMPSDMEQFVSIQPSA